MNLKNNIKFFSFQMVWIISSIGFGWIRYAFSICTVPINDQPVFIENAINNIQ